MASSRAFCTSPCRTVIFIAYRDSYGGKCCKGCVAGAARDRQPHDISHLRFAGAEPTLPPLECQEDLWTYF